MANRASRVPLLTPDGAFDAFALMDAASMHIFGIALVAAGSESPSDQEAAKLLRQAWETRKEWPERLVLPRKVTQDNGSGRAAHGNGIPLVTVAQSALTV